MPALVRAAAASGSAAPGASRYVYVGSRLEQRGDVARQLATPRGKRNWDAPLVSDAEERFDTFGEYGTAKQAGTALTYELARRTRAALRLDGAGDVQSTSVAIHACTPGLVHTNLGRFVGPVWRTLAAPVQWAMTKTSAQGAEVPLWVVTSEDAGAAPGGGYFGTEGSLRSGPVIALTSSTASNDAELAGKLWAACEEMHGPVDAPIE